MRLSYHADTDSLYIHLVEHPGVEAREVATGVVVDFDANGKPVGIDMVFSKTQLRGRVG